MFEYEGSGRYSTSWLFLPKVRTLARSENFKRSIRGNVKLFRHDITKYYSILNRGNFDKLRSKYLSVSILCIVTVLTYCQIIHILWIFAEIIFLTSSYKFHLARYILEKRTPHDNLWHFTIGNMKIYAPFSGVLQNKPFFISLRL